MTLYYATIEYLGRDEAALITLTTATGDFAGAGRIESRPRRRDFLYEEGYRYASLSARSKGGRLERYSEVTS